MWFDASAWRPGVGERHREGLGRLQARRLGVLRAATIRMMSLGDRGDAAHGADRRHDPKGRGGNSKFESRRESSAGSQGRSFL